MAIDTITLRGGLVRDAELCFTPSGAAVTNFTIAQTNNRYNDQTSQWETTAAIYLNVTIWDENNERKQNLIPWARMAADLVKGDQVTVTGQLRTRKFEDKHGNKRSVAEFAATEFTIKPRPDQAAAQQQPAATQNPPQGGFATYNPQTAAQQPNFGATQQQPQQQQAPATNDVWNSAPQQQTLGGEENPPF